MFRETAARQVVQFALNFCQRAVEVWARMERPFAMGDPPFEFQTRPRCTSKRWRTRPRSPNRSSPVEAAPSR